MGKGGLATGLLIAALTTAAAQAGSDAASRYPPPERAWNKGDYVQFYFTHFNGNRALPHLRDAKMRALFDRLVSADNLARLVAAPMPEAEKLAAMRVMLSALGEIRAAYNISVKEGEPLAEELSRVQIFMLAAIDGAMQVATAAGAAPSRAWATIITGIVVSLGEDDIYSAEQRRRLADALAWHYAGLRPALLNGANDEIAAEIGTLAARQSDPALRNSLKRLLIAVSES